MRSNNKVINYDIFILGRGERKQERKKMERLREKVGKREKASEKEVRKKAKALLSGQFFVLLFRFFFSIWFFFFFFFLATNDRFQRRKEEEEESDTLEVLQLWSSPSSSQSQLERTEKVQELFYILEMLS